MLVTAITQQKRDESKYNIFLDGEYSFALPMQDILYFKLKEGQEVSAETVDFIRKNLIYVKAQDAALHYISYKMRTLAEVRQKLTEKEFAEDVIEQVIAFLEKYGYVDDREYCRKYIAERLRLRPKGAYALRVELRQRGISAELADEVLAETEIDEEEDALRWLEKKTKGNFCVDRDEKRRLQSFLARKGYSYSVIEAAFRRMEEQYGGEA